MKIKGCFQYRDPPHIIFVLGFCTVLEGLCQILTLGMWLGPGLGLRFLLWNLDRRTSSCNE